MVATAVGVVVAATIGAVLLTHRSTPAGPAQAAQALRAALGTARRAGNFHYRAVATQGNQSQVIVGDATPDGGRQQVTFGTQRFSLVLVGKTVYFQGNAAAVEGQLGLAPPVASAEANHWISLQPGDPPYATVEPGITTASALAQVSFDPATMTTSTAGGRSVRRIVGVPSTSGSSAGTPAAPVAGRAGLQVDVASGLPTVFSTVVTAGQGQQSSTIRFSRWHERVRVAVPPGPVTYASLPAPTLQPVPGAGGPTLIA